MHMGMVFSAAVFPKPHSV